MKSRITKLQNLIDFSEWFCLLEAVNMSLICCAPVIGLHDS